MTGEIALELAQLGKVTFANSFAGGTRKGFLLYEKSTTYTQELLFLKKKSPAP